MQRHFPTLVQSIALGALASITLIACDDSSHNDPISCDSIDECPANHECQENVCVDQRDAIPKTCGTAPSTPVRSATTAKITENLITAVFAATVPHLPFVATASSKQVKNATT